MAEGSSGISETFKYLCIAKPLLVHTYPETPEHVEKMFKYCLLSGASYSIGASSKEPIPPAITPQIQEMFSKCIPLIEKTFGYKWLLEPAPLELPYGYKGNIFISPDNNKLVITLISPYGNLLHSGNFIENNLSIKVKTKLMNNFSEATSFTTHTPEKFNADFKKGGDKITISIKEHSVMSVIIIE
jgi:hypothetical protein